MAKILILSALLVAVLVSSGCIQQKCPESCDDGNDCTKDYCSAVTDYRCKNDYIVPCCGNSLCDLNESYNTCPKDCSKPIKIDKPIPSVRVYEQGGDWTIFRREVYEPPPSGISSSIITIPISIIDRIEEIRIQTECNVDENIMPIFGSLECVKPSDCNLGKTNINLNYRNIVRNLEKGDFVNAKFVLWAGFDDDTHFFKCQVTLTGNNPEQIEVLDFDFTYSNYVEKT